MDDEAEIIIKEIAELKDRVISLNTSIKALEEKKGKLLTEKYDSVWCIQCRPDDSKHAAHRIGPFSTYEKAKTHLPTSGTSHDMDDNVTWYYSIVERKAKECFMKKLDNPPPDYFPYSGW